MRDVVRPISGSTAVILLTQVAMIVFPHDATADTTTAVVRGVVTAVSLATRFAAARP